MIVQYYTDPANNISNSKILTTLCINFAKYVTQLDRTNVHALGLRILTPCHRESRTSHSTERHIPGRSAAPRPQTPRQHWPRLRQRTAS